jgi:hypothetical protein
MWNSLEIVKLVVSVLTPLAVFLMGYLVNTHLKKIEGERQDQLRKIESERQDQFRVLFEQQLRLANRNEFQRLTLEINKEVIRDPSLDAFDSPSGGANRPPDRVKLEALAHVYLNMFELVYTYYQESERLSQREQEEWRVWQELIRLKVADSLILRDVIANEDSPRVYGADFFQYIKGLSDSTKCSS